MENLEEMKLTLSRYILEEIRKEFDLKHLSGNLARTMKITNRNGNVSIEIPADKYDINIYKKTGTIVYKGHGSYADKLNQYGSMYGNHKGFVDRAVDAAIKRWKIHYGLNIKENE